MSKKNSLTIKEVDEGGDPSLFRISSCAHRNGLTIRPFRFLENYSDQNSDHELARFKKYRKPILRKGARWWIEYWYRIPKDLAHLYDNKEWRKFRVFENINREKTDEYAQFLLRAVKSQLEKGFDPFKYEQEVMADLKQEISRKKVWTITQGLNLFLQKWADRGNEPDTLRAYEYAVKMLQKWLTVRKLQNKPLEQMEGQWIEACLREGAQAEKWSNRTYNNYLQLMRTAFNFLVKKRLLTWSPGADVDRKKAKSQKHRYYDPPKFKLVRELMTKHDPALLFAAKLVYYLCIRSSKELRLFKVGNIFPDRRQVLIRADDSKTDSDRYIAIPDELLPDLMAIREKYPVGYYVVGAWHKGNVKVAENKPAPKPFGKNFLTKRFGEIRKLAALDSSFTIYGFKHTRIIHLKQDGAKDQDIIGLTGHTTFEAYAGYLRDLGIDSNPEAINKITRTF